MIARVKCDECPKNEDDKIFPFQPPRVPSIFNRTIHYGLFLLPKKSHHSQHQLLLIPIEPKFMSEQLSFEIDALARAFRNFEGGVVAVSYSFRLIFQMAAELWEAKNNNIMNQTEI
ncbi:hypothetical protein BY996DRAFT_6415138 [Phakopsora pachyrhizi]|uniref:Uncharacterized protein n=1 Tax=Phakopsora pachyrhizi TaxID=170000 RepID=A0AAV0B7F4_PHAPC|nr:hypothetical protein BY996DRAFT_6415138 [Phakopsora pachyrhizi]CAH7682890.1 hypothetical protein PPACK8108_LOCUS16046 [Phakopsora pachyrhizi]CAH7683841.1 hypothetical protein PPACK8108_LOCUS17604 [Phakopsora pachyrhizi]